MLPEEHAPHASSRQADRAAAGWQVRHTIAGEAHPSESSIHAIAPWAQYGHSNICVVFRVAVMT